MFTASVTTTGILMAFYFVLLVKWGCIKRPGLYFVGVAAIAVDLLLVGIFGSIAERWSSILCGIISAFCNVIAFVSVVIACCGKDLPIRIPTIPGMEEPPKQ